MTTEAPDGPMPLCFSPENYRAEVTRRKSAERERDDLAKQAERLIEENEKLKRECERHRKERAAELNRDSTAIADLVAERAELRANVATLVEQLGEAERRIAEARASIGVSAETTAALRAEGYVVAHRSQVARAAQPVVEPRDETWVPPGFSPYVFGDRSSTVEFVERKAWKGTLTQARELYDSEHRGYAPHPSGTEGPLRARLLFDAVRASFAEADDWPELSHLQSWVQSRWHNNVRVALAGGRDFIRTDGQVLREAVAARAAASPPDGTAPERAAEERWRAEYALAEGELRAHLADFGWDPQPFLRHGLQVAIKRVCDRLNDYKTSYESLATRPPDGMPGEPARADVLDEDSDTFRHIVAAHGRDEALRRAALCGIHPPAAPPTVPGELPRKIRCGDTVKHRPTGEDWLVAYADYERGKLSPCGWPESIADIADCELVESCTDEEHRNLVAQLLAGRGDHRRGQVERLYAAPPTPPLTPERAPLDAEVKLHLKDYRGLDELRRVHEWLSTGRSVAVMCEDAEMMRFEPPGERAPLDEAAVRADERAKTERDIAEWLDGFANLRGEWLEERAFAAKLRDAMRKSDYPRRSEGAG